MAERPLQLRVRYRVVGDHLNWRVEVGKFGIHGRGPFPVDATQDDCARQAAQAALRELEIAVGEYHDARRITRG